MKTLLLLLATAGSLLGCYLPPAEGVLLIRRDALPLDINRQVLLSKDLLAYATRPSAIDTAEDRRATAQLIALAANLNPQSKGAANLNRAYCNDNEDSEIFSNYELEEPLANITKTARFLLSDPDNKRNIGFAQLLLDPFVVILPDSDLVNTRPNPKESPRWFGVVAPLDQFTKAATQPDSTPPKDELKMTEDPEEIPTNHEEKPTFQVADFSGSIITPSLLVKKSEDRPDFKFTSLSPLSFKGKLAENSGQLSTPYSQDSKHKSAVLNIVKANISNRHSKEIANRVAGSFKVANGQFRESNRHNIALPMTILAEGLLTETQPLENLIVLGRLTEDGLIKTPRNSIPYLETLVKNESKSPRRLLISSDLRPYLESLLIQQKEDFFFNFDIIEVSTLEEALTLSSPNTTPQSTTDALNNFAEIRRVGAGKTTSVFVANPHVLTRLDEVCRLEPRHLSAQFLKMRGQNKQPTNYPTVVLASLIQNALLPLAPIPYKNSRELDPKALTEIHKKCRASLDPLSKDIALSDRELFAQAIEVTNRLRTLSRTKAKLDKDGFYNDDSRDRELFFQTFKTIQTEFYQLAVKTTVILDQPAPKNPVTPEQPN